MWDDVLYGGATSDGAYEDVETYGEAGTTSRTVQGTANHYAFLIVVGSLALLWLLGASIFKGANQS